MALTQENDILVQIIFYNLGLDYGNGIISWMVDCGD